MGLINSRSVAASRGAGNRVYPSRAPHVLLNSRPNGKRCTASRPVLRLRKTPGWWCTRACRMLVESCFRSTGHLVCLVGRLTGGVCVPFCFVSWVKGRRWVVLTLLLQNLTLSLCWLWCVWRVFPVVNSPFVFRSLFHITSAATEFCVKQQRFRCNGKDRVQCVMFAREEEDLLFLPVVRQRPYRRVPLQGS